MIGSRVRYREGQRIGVADLRAEQDYLLGVGRRHHLTLHDWGIVFGLRVDADAGGIRVARGLAVDGLGRELLLRYPVVVPWESSTGETLETYFEWAGEPAKEGQFGGIGVWLHYAVRPFGSGGSSSACDTRQHARWDEGPYLTFTPWVPADPRLPPQGVDPDVPSWMRYVDTTEADPQWPVLLAWIEAAAGQDPPYVVDRCAPYARLIAQTVQSCSAASPPESPDAPRPAPPAPVVNTRMDLARNLGADRRLFAVRTTDAAVVARDRLRIDNQGTAEFYGAVTFAAPEEEPAPAEGDPARGRVQLTDSGFAAEDIKDPEGLVCTLDRNPAVSRLFGAAVLRRSRAIIAEADPIRLREVLARELNRVVGSGLLLGKGFRRTKGGSFDRSVFRGLSLRADTWSIIKSIAPGARVPERHLAFLVTADLLSPHVQVSERARQGSFALALRPTPLPTVARPWSVYRSDVTKDGATTRQLRIELGAPPTDAGLDKYRLAIGHDDNGFVPCLTVDAAGTVTLAGGLQVKGQIIEAPIEPNPSDPRFISEIVKAWVGGTVGGVSAASPIAIAFVNLTEAKTGTKWPYQLELTNTGNARVTDVKVFESLGINEQIVMPRPVGSFDSIDPAATKTIDVEHDTLAATTGKVTVAIGVVGRGSLLGLVVAANLKTVSIVP